MEKHNILLIEDDVNLGFMLQENLELHGFAVKLSGDGEEGLKYFLKGNYDLCLIDVMLPKKDGFTLAKEIRNINRDIPIFFLTAKSLKEDRIEGFKIGGDDYITKPFSTEELVLRIQNVLRRRKNINLINGKKKNFEIGIFRFDAEKQTLTTDSSKQKLTHKESELLRLLCLHINQTLDRDLALKMIWENNSFFSARSMDVYISKLRKFLKNDDRIELSNVHGKGFKLSFYP